MATKNVMDTSIAWMVQMKYSATKYQEFLCRDNQTCISIEDKCDGTYDCPDFSDELYCKACNCCFTKDETCHIDKFKCDNKNCVSKSVVCNGYDNCGDQSDEKICGSDDREFTGDIIDVDCAIKCEGKCVPHDKICDHITDCENGIDEIHCEYLNCPLDNLCIKNTQFCDGFIDCPDGVDEEDCGGVLIYKLLVSFVVLVVLSIIFLGITTIGSYRFNTTLRDVRSRLACHYRPIFDTCTLHNYLANTYHEFLLESPEALNLDDHDDLKSMDFN
ncbi:hypothetical protein RF11_15604 [Thelohanellus kitauei]|uniref:Uncharacterized protein n=1 Tax=Thelohanellus kitauei TaxID=669202 RepID=A0A0C2JWQ1_THEKT|nr:hypothetical protein RF11_15604 [Thelohanellus kitauei]